MWTDSVQACRVGICTFDVDRQCANLSSRYGTLHEDRQCAYLSMSNVDLNLLDGVQEARSPEPPPPVAGQNIIKMCKDPCLTVCWTPD